MDEKIRAATVNRYFTKIDEKDPKLTWDFSNGEIFLMLPNPICNSKIYLSGIGNIFAILDHIQANIFKVIFLSETPEGMKDYFNFNEFTSREALQWVLNIGDEELIIDKITDDYHAFMWARYIGDKEIMKKRITTSQVAQMWITYIDEDKDMEKIIEDEKKNDIWIFNNPPQILYGYRGKVN